jgi:DNA-directed RNA polymerase sigma subunit (sigma70/sigma32)
VRQLDPDRQAELGELMAALASAEPSSPDDPVLMYIREIAALESLPIDKETDLLAAIRHGDEAARNRLTELNVWEVVQIGTSVYRPRSAVLDLVQEGDLGLMQAVAEVPIVQGSFGNLRDARLRKAIERALD